MTLAKSWRQGGSTPGALVDSNRLGPRSLAARKRRPAALAPARGWVDLRRMGETRVDRAGAAREPLSVAVARRLIGVCALLFAVWTVMAQVALKTGLSFRTLADSYSVFLVGALTVSLVLRWRGHLRLAAGPWRADASVTLSVLALALAGGLLSLTAIRPDLDDVGYISRSVFFLEHLDHPLDLVYHDLALLDFSLEYPLRLSYTVEHFWGYIAHLVGAPYLTVYHQVVPFVGGFLLPLAWFLAVHAFSRRPGPALVGAAAIVAYLCIDGSTHRTFGNVAFVRIWQGKILLMSVFVPIFIERTLAWFERPSRASWLSLFILGVGASGLTGTSLFFVPVLAVLLGVGQLAAGGLGRRSLALQCGYFSSLAYLVGLAGYLWLSAARSDYDYIGFEIFPSTFSGQVELLFGAGISFTLCIVAIATVAALLRTQGRQRRFLAGWIVAALVLVMNPLVMPYVCLLATYNAYWRLFFTFPFPLVIGVACASAVRVNVGRSLPIAGALLLGALVFNLLAPGIATFGDDVRFGLGQDKVDSELGAEVREIVAASVPGPMIAPNRHSGLIPLYTSALPQMCVRSWLLKHFAGLAGRSGIAKSRMRAVKYVAGKKSKGFDDLRRLMSEGLNNVVIDPKLDDDTVLLDALKHTGFVLTTRGENYRLYTREAR